MDGYAWDVDEWLRRVELAEDGNATASDVLALYDSLMSLDDMPSRGVGWLTCQFNLARLTSLPYAPARMLTDMAAILVDGAGDDGFDDVAVPVVYALGDNPALSRSTPTRALNVLTGVMAACALSWGCVTTCTRTVWLGARCWVTQPGALLMFQRGLCRLCVRVSLTTRMFSHTWARVGASGR